ncbi:cellulose binding domain-containing protein [Nonomuraea typhae]|uniref:cellulose binding domain-containing protein n=1 Tax=Nonomuraea typhae TaxID=2603600 RepID=UPI0012F7530A|nr:cellulose binding domain-containing protein [Nonomuraea typhae]
MDRSGDSQEEDQRFTADPAAAWSAAPDPTATSSFFAVGDDREPGWPAPPDQIEVTGQWAPRPGARLTGDAPDPGPADSDPFETTGAFARPESYDAPPGGPRAPEPFETTGAFAPPPQPQGAGPKDRPAPGGAADRPVAGGAFRRPEGALDRPEAFDRPRGPFDRPVAGGPGDRPVAGGPGAFEPPAAGAFGAGPAGRSPEETQRFGEPVADGATAAFSAGPFATRPGDAPVQGNDPFPGNPSGPVTAQTPGAPSDPFAAQAPGASAAPFAAQAPGAPSDPFAAQAPGPPSDPFATRPGGPPPDPFATRPGGAPSDPFAAQPPGTGDFAAQAETGGFPPEPGDVKVAGSPTVVSPVPAWAEGNDGFMGAGWSSDDGGPDEAAGSRRRGRRKQGGRDGDLPGGTSGGGKARVALLSVAAVAVVLGGTVAGVNMMSSSRDCPQGNCSAVQTAGSGQPAPPSVSETGPGEGEPDEEPVETESEEPVPSESAKPSPSATVRAPRRSTPTPKPTPTKTKERNTGKPTVQPPAPTPTSSATEEPTDEPMGTAEPTSGTFPTDAVPNPQNSPSSGVRQAPNVSSVNVKFGVTNQGITGYRASLEVTNSSAQTMSSMTLSLPVSGRVTHVSGADWTQDGQLLIIDLSQSMATGAVADISFTATGKGQTPENCGLVGGECSLS